ncbi:MAG TPA: ATP-binding cassette domain-containing protein [Candidatus Paceibacterota bacterium]|nr:ATP-binding cassette domain-containing protein [Candidatus Paceibacterota bacterium]
MPSSENPKIIEVATLTKRFKDFAAVDGISFAVGSGDIFACLGPNGAGKSTLIKMLITLLEPTSGTASVAGHDISRHAAEVRNVIGYVPQSISVDGTLTAYENLMLFARLYDIPRSERKARIQETLSFLKLEAHADALVRTFSGGMIRKMEIGQAMLHRPKVLFLDEPTTGLDPIAQQSVWGHLSDLRETTGTTIFFSTHNMEEADGVSDQVAIMNQGKIAVIGSVAELKAKTGKPNATLEDAFIFFSGNTMSDTGNFRDIRRMRQTEKRLG